MKVFYLWFIILEVLNVRLDGFMVRFLLMMMVDEMKGLYIEINYFILNWEKLEIYNLVCKYFLMI